LSSRIDQARDVNVQVVKDNASADRSYQLEWKRFQEWIDNGRQINTIPAGDKYLTRENVDVYFGEVVSKYTVVTDSARRIISSLQWYSDNNENPTEKFKVESPAVLAALKAQKHHRISIDAKKIRDPHGKLPTDVLSEAEYDIAHGKIMLKMDWLDLQLSWTTCDQTYLRYSSFSKLTLADIRLDKAHGPPKDTGRGNKAMVSLILRPFGVHKDRYKHTKVVGGWRHFKPFRCMTGALAMTLMVRFRFDARLTQLNFYSNANHGADWWNIPLRATWGSKTNSAESAFKKLYQEAGISWSKNLHLRKGGMDKAGTAGLSEEAVSTMSKHSTAKIRQYMPELHAEVMCVMAGFQPNEEYYVPRCLLELPWTEDEIVRAVFPKYNTWIHQYQSPDGDHSDAAKNFLLETLPFLAMVAIQDGIYWIKEYPNNSASVMLKDTFPNYEAWALHARKEVVQQQAGLQESRISTMNTATQASFHVIQRQMNRIEEKIDEKDQKVSAMEQRIKLMEREKSNVESERDQYKLLLEQSNHSAANQQGISTMVHFAPIAPQISPTHRRTIQVPPQGNALVALRSSERLPNIPQYLPKTLYELLVQHRQLNLVSFELAKKKHWPQEVQLRFSKRTYLYNKIRERAQRHQGSTEGERMDNAAMAMDTEKTAKVTMDKFLKILKSNDPTTKKRSKRKAQEM